MEKTITGLMFGSKKDKQGLKDSIIWHLSIFGAVKIKRFRKLKGKDLYEYSAIITIK
jgi:hypothetical protein